MISLASPNKETKVILLASPPETQQLLSSYMRHAKETRARRAPLALPPPPFLSHTPALCHVWLPQGYHCIGARRKLLSSSRLYVTVPVARAWLGEREGLRSRTNIGTPATPGLTLERLRNEGIRRVGHVTIYLISCGCPSQHFNRNLSRSSFQSLTRKCVIMQYETSPKSAEAFSWLCSQISNGWSSVKSM